MTKPLELESWHIFDLIECVKMRRDRYQTLSIEADTDNKPELKDIFANRAIDLQDLAQKLELVRDCGLIARDDPNNLPECWWEISTP